MDYQIYPVEFPTKDRGKPVRTTVKSKELDNLNRIDLKKHENNGHTCKQCNSQYESREDLEHHKRIRHRQYNDKQINNYQANRRQLRNQTDRINLKKSKNNLDGRHDIEKQNNEKPDFYNENFGEEELKTNKNNDGKIFERTDKTDEENKRTIEKMKNELGEKSSGNQAVCADTNDNPYNNKKHNERMTVISQYSPDREEKDITPSIN